MAQKSSKVLSVFLWLAQGILALTFLWLGFMKIFSPAALPFPWAKEHPSLVTITGIVDVLGGLGIILPTLLRIKPQLTILAAYGIILLMIVASAFHISRGEAQSIGFNISLLLIAAFVAWGRRKLSKQ